MKKTILLIFSVLLLFAVSGQEITGQWNGILKVPGAQLRLVFHIDRAGDGYSSTMDSPDQHAVGIPVTSTTFEKSVLKLLIEQLKVEFTGTYEGDDLIRGTFTQAGMSFPLDLSKKPVELKKPARPQEPALPYPYYSEEVKFENSADQVVLTGTLTLPAREGRFPAVVLITGSGPQNRDEEVFGHKPFLVLADYLTRNGIAVLRFDDRGVAQSTGNFKQATTLDFAKDAEAAVRFLKSRKEIDAAQIGLVGHSEGGIIAPIVAASQQDIAFLVLLAGTGIPGGELLLKQQKLIGQSLGISETELAQARTINAGAYELVARNGDPARLEEELKAYFREQLPNFPASQKPAGMDDAQLVARLAGQLANPWMSFFISYNPYTILSRVKCPVLALNGEKDLQVPAAENLAAIKEGLKKGGNPNVTAIALPGLNHLFQECKTGSPGEYTEIEQTFSPGALKVIADWIKSNTR